MFPVGLPCPLKAMTGLDCPLCGATRATFALIRGDLGTALDFNALYVVLVPVIALVAVFWLIRRRTPAVLRWQRFPVAALLVAIVYMAVRNLPFAPFDYLGT
jgi:hypothetical protein